MPALIRNNVASHEVEAPTLDDIADPWGIEAPKLIYDVAKPLGGCSDTN